MVVQTLHDFPRGHQELSKHFEDCANQAENRDELRPRVQVRRQCHGPRPNTHETMTQSSAEEKAIPKTARMRPPAIPNISTPSPSVVAAPAAPKPRPRS